MSKTIYKQMEIVMLPSNSEARINSIVKNKEGKLAIVNPLTIDDPNKYLHQHMHLYFLSNEIINVGNLVVVNGKIVKAEMLYGAIGYNTNRGFLYFLSKDKKIIATTDLLKPSLYNQFYNQYESLPQPPQSFVEIFVREYNKGNVITSVMVEYWDDSDYNPSPFPDVRLKIKSGNTIILNPIENNMKTTNKEEALKRLASIEKETIELKKIINQKDDDWTSIVDFKSACHWLDRNDMELLGKWRNADLTNTQIAGLMLETCIEALNTSDGKRWVPNWNDTDTLKYYVYFDHNGGVNCIGIRSNGCMGFGVFYETEEKARHGTKFFKEYYHVWFGLKLWKFTQI